MQDRDVTHVMQSLPKLQLLLLNSCRKLTPAAVASLLPLSAPQRSEPASGGAPQSCETTRGGSLAPLRGLALARCFQLDGRALSGLLQEAPAGGDATDRRPDRELQSILLSHLDLAHWAPATCLRPRTALRILALHNCEKLPPSALYVRSA